MPSRSGHRTRRRRGGRSLVARLAGFVLVLAAAAVLVPAVLLLGLRWVDPPTTAYMLQSPVRPVAHEWVALQSLPAHVPLAAVAAEDQRFVLHRGFDTDQIRRAISERADGGRLRGASTITQQLARNLLLWPGGGFVRKGIEAGLTVQLELLWPKRRILEVYLNVAEFAPGVYGVGAAARRHFGKPAEALSAREAALLMAVLPSPRRFDAGEPSAYVRQRADWIQGQMRSLGPGWLAPLQARGPEPELQPGADVSPPLLARSAARTGTRNGPVPRWGGTVLARRRSKRRSLDRGWRAN